MVIRFFTSETKRIIKFIVYVLSVSMWFNSNAAEKDYYKLTTVSFPDDLKLEVSGMATLPGDRMAIAIRKGEVWIADKLSTDNPVYKQFASGLHEPLGLALHKGDLFTVQRSELTRLRDTNFDGRADEYLTFAKGWGVTGNYHEYAYGPAVDGEGNLGLRAECAAAGRRARAVGRRRAAKGARDRDERRQDVLVLCGRRRRRGVGRLLLAPAAARR